LHEYIAQASQKQPNDSALLRCDINGNIEEVISYKELSHQLLNIASWLAYKGIKPGEKIGIAMFNSPEFLMTSWAAWGVGAVTVPLDTKRDTLYQHKYKLDKAGVKLIVTTEGVFKKEEKRQLSKYKIIEIQSLGLKKNINKRAAWKSDLNHQALILFTSGTTAHPKGAQLSLKNLVINALSIKEWFKITKKDRFMVVLPLQWRLVKIKLKD